MRGSSGPRGYRVSTGPGAFIASTVRCTPSADRISRWTACSWPRCSPASEASLGHRSALRKWELRGGGTHRIDVIAPRSVKPKDGIRLHRPRSLDAVETTELDGIPITTAAQTLLDVAAPAYRLDMGKLLHRAIVAELFDARAISAVLARNPNAPGARRLAEAMTEEAPFTRSGLEDAALALFRSCSVPEPECNAWVWDGERLVEVDFVWRDARVIVEVDGWRYHRSRWRRRQDAAKTAALEAQGWTVRGPRAQGWRRRCLARRW
jgi:hypothetical protein